MPSWVSQPRNGHKISMLAPESCRMQMPRGWTFSWKAQSLGICIHSWLRGTLKAAWSRAGAACPCFSQPRNGRKISMLAPESCRMQMPRGWTFSWKAQSLGICIHSWLRGTLKAAWSRAGAACPCLSQPRNGHKISMLAPESCRMQMPRGWTFSWKAQSLGICIHSWLRGTLKAAWSRAGAACPCLSQPRNGRKISMLAPESCRMQMPRGWTFSWKAQSLGICIHSWLRGTLKAAWSRAGAACPCLSQPRNGRKISMLAPESCRMQMPRSWTFSWKAQSLGICIHSWLRGTLKAAWSRAGAACPCFSQPRNGRKISMLAPESCRMQMPRGWTFSWKAQSLGICIHSWLRGTLKAAWSRAGAACPCPPHHASIASKGTIQERQASRIG